MLGVQSDTPVGHTARRCSTAFDTRILIFGDYPLTPRLPVRHKKLSFRIRLMDGGHQVLMGVFQQQSESCTFLCIKEMFVHQSRHKLLCFLVMSVLKCRYYHPILSRKSQCFNTLHHILLKICCCIEHPVSLCPEAILRQLRFSKPS